MSDTSGGVEVAKLRSAIHGAPVGRRGVVYCDFCEGVVPIDEPLVYDVVRVYDLATLEALLDFPEQWIPDAARCRNCAVETVFPETDGWEEAIVRVEVNSSTDVLSLDASSLTVLDYSPGDVGTHPPPIPLSAVNRTGYSFSRWGFMKSALATDDVDLPQVSIYRDMLAEIERHDE